MHDGLLFFGAAICCDRWISIGVFGSVLEGVHLGVVVFDVKESGGHDGMLRFVYCLSLAVGAGMSMG
jgi:hypothetical protein